MPADRDQLRAQYATGQEWARLDGDEGWLEYHRTTTLIARHIPAGSRVLDLGGGPGRYALDLARRGDTVTLVDLSAHHIDQARAHAADAGLTERITAVIGDAADLSRVPGAPFEAVLALGPLYHAADLDELQGFVAQIASVLEPGGVLLAAFIPRTSGLSGLIAGSGPMAAGDLRRAMQTGQLGEAFFPHPEQVRAALSADFTDVGIFSLRGLGSGYGAQLRAQIAQPRFKEVMAVIDETAHRPDVIGLGWHAVAVGIRR